MDGKVEIELCTDVKSSADSFTIEMARTGFEYKSVSDPPWYVPCLATRVYTIIVTVGEELKDLICERADIHGLDLWGIREAQSVERDV